MRMRKKPWAENEITNNAYVVNNPEQNAGKWHDIFGNKNPVRVEIGMGKGRFLLENAQKHPHINFVGLERQVSVLAQAARKIRLSGENKPNLRIIVADAGSINKIFDKNEVSQIYINFCDPWHKRKYENRRLTHGGFLKLYEEILANEGKLCLKTDNEELFKFSLAQLAEYGWKNADTASEEPAGGVASEYEERFRALGKEIFSVSAIAPSSGQTENIAIANIDVV